ncbi:unnamed protein product, partial [Closterium sp. Naga37s-1]
PSLPSLAVCLVGGARDLDATGPTITQHLLPSLLPFDLFIHAPLDENAAKISALARAHAMHGNHATASRSSSSSSSTDNQEDSSRSGYNEQQGAAGKMAGAIKGVRVFPVVPVDASLYPGSIIILPWGSPNGVQGILQYFRLIEGCLPLIEREEKTNRAGQQYRWVLRTRLDGYWSAPAPPLSSFIGWAEKGVERREGGEEGGGGAEGKEGESIRERAAYVVPYGSNWGGVNDRFGFGRREESVVALSRLAMLDEINRYRQRIGVKRQMNSEITFKLQLNSRDIAVQPANLPFCVLSRRAFPDACSSITVSINASVPLNGAKCQPCHPCAQGKEVETILNATSPSSDKWLGPVQSGVAFCPGGKGSGKGRSSADGSWPSDWEEIYRRTAGDELGARQRRIRSRVGEIGTCTRFLEKMRATVSNWDAPSPLALCVRSALGAPSVLGAPHDSFPIFSSLLSAESRILHLEYTALQAATVAGKAGAGGSGGGAGGAEGGGEGEQAQEGQSWGDAVEAAQPGVRVTRASFADLQLAADRQEIVPVLKVSGYVVKGKTVGEQLQEGQSWEEAVERAQPGMRVTIASFADLQLAADRQEIVPVLKVTVHGPTQPIELLSSLASFSLPPLCLLLLRALPCSPEI